MKTAHLLLLNSYSEGKCVHLGSYPNQQSLKQSLKHPSTHQLVNNSIVVKIPNKFPLWSMVFWTNYQHQNDSTGINVLFVKVA